jgi:four helix bundle protein
VAKGERGEEGSMGKGGFRSLLVWQKAKDLAVHIYRITDEGLIRNDFGLRDQIRRSGVSIASNIAEGDERSTDKDSNRFLYMAKGSLAELLTQLQIAHEVGYFTECQFIDVESRCSDIGRMLGRLIKARSEGNSA